jgi:hypothetical protein
MCEVTYCLPFMMDEGRVNILPKSGCEIKPNNRGLTYESSIRANRDKALHPVRVCTYSGILTKKNFFFTRRGRVGGPFCSTPRDNGGTGQLGRERQDSERVVTTPR